ncbi:MAG: LysR substrate-binding domain-containing protein [Granulosicoccaceae bacterium]
MRELWKLVRSPRHLIVFEAAARLGSFTRAAEELSVQQPAVSASIKQLEQALGVVLFQRGHRQITLTSSGQRLFADVSQALNSLYHSALAINQSSQAGHVTLNSSSAFAYYWLMPRLKDLHQRSPEIDLRLQSSDREPDLDAEGISLAVRRGDGHWPNCHSHLIAPEVIFPVASPRVMQTAKLRNITSMLQQPLVHLEEPIRERPTWAQWFEHHGMQHQQISAGLRLNDYALVLQAAIAGEGFAFGWKHVTSSLIAQKLLSAKTEWSWKTGLGFYLVWSKNQELSPPANEVREWIIEQTSQTN